jgi:hypothetical protein
MLNQEIIDLIKKVYRISTGIIDSININTGKCVVKLDNVDLIECDISYSKANTDSDVGIVWGNISYPSIGDYVIVFFEAGTPYIIESTTGYKNVNEIYDNGKVTINRIPDSDDTEAVDSKLKLGEFLLRSIGLGDIFFDKFGNIVCDSSKEFVIRIGDRDSDNIIASPETTLRIGKIKDSNGDIKVDDGNKKIKFELIFNNNNKLVLNEVGQWTISNNSTSIILQDDGKILINGNNDNLVTYSTLNTALQGLVSGINTTFGTKLDGGGTPGTLTLNITGAKADNLQTDG